MDLSTIYNCNGHIEWPVLGVYVKMDGVRVNSMPWFFKSQDLDYSGADTILTLVFQNPCGNQMLDVQLILTDGPFEYAIVDIYNRTIGRAACKEGQMYWRTDSASEGSDTETTPSVVDSFSYPVFTKRLWNNNNKAI